MEVRFDGSTTFNHIAMRFADAGEAFRRHREEVLKELGDNALQVVQQQIPVEHGKYTRRMPGTVREEWQERYIGSGRGYVAIRPRGGYAENKAGTETEDYRIGHIMQSIEGGHRSSGEHGFVRGMFSYMKANRQTADLARDAARLMRQRLESELNGK